MCNLGINSTQGQETQTHNYMRALKHEASRMKRLGERNALRKSSQAALDQFQIQPTLPCESKIILIDILSTPHISTNCNSMVTLPISMVRCVVWIYAHIYSQWYLGALRDSNVETFTPDVDALEPERLLNTAKLLCWLC